MPTLEIYDWQEEGYRPLLIGPQWMVALLNWDSGAERKNLTQVERHNQTDEVFVLLRGRSVLLVHAEGSPVEVHDLEPEKIYNVPAGVWHSTVSSRDVKFLIVENQGTNLHDTELRPITPEELAELDRRLPDWAK